LQLQEKTVFDLDEVEIYGDSISPSSKVVFL